MSFDATHFARELLGALTHSEVLGCACTAASELSNQPAFAAHLVPGRPWEQATMVSSQANPGEIPVPVRSALFAVYRRISLTDTSLHLEREPETDAIFRALLPDGASELHAAPFRSRDGRLAGAIVVGRAASIEPPLAALEAIADLTGPALESAWRHTLARRDQERLNLLSETTAETLWDWNVPLDEVWWGGNIEQLFGRETRVSKRTDWRSTRIHTDDAARVIASFKAALTGRTSAWSAEYRLHGADDALIDVREQAYFLREVDGRAYRVLGTVRDVSAIQHLLARETLARTEAERASAAKDEFLAMLGHELRNPLAPIFTALQLIKLRAGDLFAREQAIIDRQLTHLTRLVDDLLDIARVTSGKVTLNLGRIALKDALAKAVETVAPLIQDKQHLLKLDVTPADLVIEGDLTRIAQILQNLLMNAAKYTDPRGRIELRTLIEGEEVCISIRDSGMGIDQALLPHVFDLFRQGATHIDRSRGGLGIGLALVKSLVTLHGGRVEARSRGAGHGSEFLVWLPHRQTSRLVPGAERTKAVGLAPGPSCPILLVDDNIDAALSLTELLRAFGYTVAVAHDSAEALRSLRNLPPGVAILDIGLPGMDGYELARQIRAMLGSRSPHLIALTGYGQQSDRQRAQDAGFDRHLVKPVDIEELLRYLALVTSTRRVE